ncbi:hypothetical protein BH09ACT1_BH09ACT1_12940 [soil metagenome]
MHVRTVIIRLTAILAGIGPLIFLITEAIAALGWKAGTYNYGVNFISDLGTTVCGSHFGGREMCSPLHAVMNFGFAAMGISVAIAVALVAVSLPRGRRIFATVLGCLLAVGMLLVASFHGGIESVANGTIILHVLGATVAILVGNTLGIIMGVNRRSLEFPNWFGPAAITVGIVGILSLVGCLVFNSAIFERMSVYAIFAWLLTVSALLLRRASATTIPRSDRR